MTPFKHVLNLFLLLLIPVLFVTSCSDPAAKPLFKYSETRGDGETITNVTNAEGENVLSYSMKTSFTSQFKYNKFNLMQVEGIEGEGYVTVETGEEILVDTYLEMDVYEEPEYKKFTTKEGKLLGQVEAAGRFDTSLPIRFYSFDGEEINLEKSPHSPNLIPKEFNFVYTKGLDTLIVLPKKVIEDSLGSRLVGFTSIQLDRIHEVLPFIRNLNTKEQTIYDKIPSFAENDFKMLLRGKM